MNLLALLLVKLVVYAVPMFCSRLSLVFSQILKIVNRARASFCIEEIRQIQIFFNPSSCSKGPVNNSK
jgi:hypothetical protein